MSVMFKYLAAAAVALLLAACGQTGPLYLPDEPQQIIVRGQDARKTRSTSDTPTQTTAKPQADPRGL